LCFFIYGLTAFGQVDNDYFQFVDSADVHIDADSKKALSFLDAIPEPIEKNIPGRVADYYSIKSLIYDDLNEYTMQHQCIILTLKYAKKENNFCVAGKASIDIFLNLYFIKKDRSAFRYLDEAITYYKKCDYEYGAIEVLQVRAYAKYLDGEYKASNILLLSELDTYKSINEDAYYYMFALYMLTSNYIYLNDLENARKYFKEFKRLKNNSTIVKYNYFNFEAGINKSFGDFFFNKKQIDSTLFYLEKSTKLTDYMSEDVLKNYYRLYADTNKYLGDIDKSKTYIDSLIFVQNRLFNRTVKASFKVNDSLITAESELIVQNDKKAFNRIVAGFSVLALLLLSLLIFVYYWKQKKKLEEHNLDIKNSLLFLKTNNEQLGVKVYGLEEYIQNLKKEVKQISRTGSVDHQKEKIKNLYKNLHLNSSTLLDKSENHLDLVNNLNIAFFRKIEENYPKLNKPEIIICYYLFMGFTNKEIAVFLNTTIRSVESRRYRISKKMNLSKKDMTLLEFLQSTFSDTLKNNELS
jgi:DNA-binding CsgD family transcriptional regulator